MTSNVPQSVQERAAKHGVVISETDDGFVASWPKFNKHLTGASPRLVLDDMIAFIKMATMYRSFTLYNGATDANGRAVYRIVVPKVGEYDSARLGDALDAAITDWQTYRANLDEEEDTSDEEKDAEYAGSVVGGKYRARYADLGHPTHCGDHLASVLNNLVANRKGTNIELFVEICSVNGVDLSKYKRDSRGWQGRLRMTGRNILARRVYDTGVLKLPEHLGQPNVPMPQEWLEAQRFVK